MAGENTEIEAVNPLDLSDAEIMRLGSVEAFNREKGTSSTTGAEVTTEQATQTAATEEDTDPPAGEDNETSEEAAAGGEEKPTEASDAAADAAKAAKQAAERDEHGKFKKAGEKTPAEANKPEGEQDPEKKPEGEKPTVNFETEYKRLMAPFKANGRDVQVESVDDAIALMQMGANYNKKMAALKPNLKLLKLLENNGLLDEGKLNFLIDLDKKSPEAITKLVKDSGLNPMDLDTEKAGDYKPQARKVDDRELALDEVLDSIQDTPSYRKTLDVVGTKWDQASKDVIGQTPQLLKTINDHIDRGIYDVIAAGVERERMLGRLQGVSDLEAYRQVGDAINARGGFNHLVSSQGKTVASEKVVIQPKPKQGSDGTRDEKRRSAAAAAAPAGASSKSDQPDFNPLNLSDDEFTKLAQKRFR